MYAESCVSKPNDLRQERYKITKEGLQTEEAGYMYFGHERFHTFANLAHDHETTTVRRFALKL